MIRQILAITAIAGFLIPGLATSAEKYMVDPVHSSVEFGVRHLVISKVTGKFTEFSGTINLDMNDMTKSGFSGEIKVTSVNTNNVDRDKHLRSTDFFDVENYPEIKFESKKVIKKGNDYVAIGDFTMRGVTKEIRVPFKFLGTAKSPYGQEVIAMEAELTINRQDYGLSFNKVLESGGLVVGNEVEISINIEAVKQE